MLRIRVGLCGIHTLDILIGADPSYVMPRHADLPDGPICLQSQ